MATSPLTFTPNPGRPRIFESIATFAVIAALLYLGAGILVPVVLAVMLAFALTPLVGLLGRVLHVPDAVAVIMAVVIALAALVGFAYLAGSQVINLAQELPGYQETVAAKIESVQEQFGGPFLKQLNDTFAEVSDQLAGSEDPAPGAPVPVTISNEIGPIGIMSSLLGSVIGPVATAAIVTVFLIFLLMGRADLQDRFIRLVSVGGYSTTNIAIADASRRVGRYLLLQLGVNAAYGTIFAIGLWLIGVPSAVLWGLLIILFRYIPFVGALIIAVIPFMLAFAVDPGWNMLLMSVGLFLVLDLTTANVVEPRLYGSSTGVSAIAILLSAMFWATLWGPVGLILATPMTVCLVVIGRHLPQFQFLETLLGSEPVLTPAERLYQRMLKGDTEDAIDLTEDYIEEFSTEAYMREVMLPALRLANAELSDRPEALAQRRQLVQTIDAVIAELADVPSPEQSDILLVGGRTEIDESAAQLVALGLAEDGVAARVLPPVAIRQEAIGRLDLEGVDVVGLVFMGGDIKAQIRYVTRRIRRRAPTAKVLACILDAGGQPVAAEALRVDAVFRSLDEAVDGIRKAWRRQEQLEQPAALANPFAGAGRGDDLLGHAIQEVADSFQVPVAAINLLDDDRHIEEEDAFRLTRIVADTGAPLVVQSDVPHPLVGDNAYLQTNGIDLYAGVPLVLAGKCIGALVLLDYEPHPFGPEDAARLQAAADQLVRSVAPQAVASGSLGS